MNNFIIGQYYYFESYSARDSNIARHDRPGNGLRSDSWIMVHNSKRSCGGGSWSLDNMYNIRLATKEELHKYLSKEEFSKLILRKRLIAIW